MFNAKKLLLVTAIAAISSSAFAMEALDDGTMSNATGQDGLTIGLDTEVQFSTYLHDTDGIPDDLISDKVTAITGTPGFVSYANPGAFVLEGMSVDGGSTGTKAHIAITADAGSSAAGDAALHIGITLGKDSTSVTRFNLGNLTVGVSPRTAHADTAWAVTNQTDTLMQLGSVSLGLATMGLELGNEPQGSMFRMETIINKGISINGFAINDVANGFITDIAGGGIGVDTLEVMDSGSESAPQLTTTVLGDISTAGLVVTLDTLGGTNGIDVNMKGVKMGDLASAPYVGDLQIVGLKLSGTTLTISGH